MSFNKTVVIIGGGIAGTSCAQHIATYSPDIKVILIAATDVIKTAVTTQKITRLCQEVNVVETKGGLYEQRFNNVQVIVGFVSTVNANEHYCELSNGTRYDYDKLCICTGALPNSIIDGICTGALPNSIIDDICTGALPNSIIDDNEYVMTLRDTDNVRNLIQKISKSKKIIVIGNGGIALELIYELKQCEVCWCIRDDYIGSTFLDQGASAFLLPRLNQVETQDIGNRKADQLVFKRKRHKVEREEFSTNDNPKVSSSKVVTGSALGPDWCSNHEISGSLTSDEQRNIHVEYSCETNRIYTSTKPTDIWNVYVELSNGKTIGADYIISATGVKSNINFQLISTETLKLSDDHFICVNDNMQTNIKDLYAAGDICNTTWPKASNWFQMKLWTQALQLGAYAGRCIAENFDNTQSTLDFCFELFTHATTFFGFKVILLGNYNFQNLNHSECNILLRYTNDVEYVKLVLMNGRVQGAILIGETDLEETIENLILNQLDVEFLGESLLDPQVDIEDYFD